MTTREFLLTSWNWNPLLIASCVLGFWLYGFILRWKFEGKSAYFFSGLALAFLALASPLDRLARGYLFSAHMLQHLLLVLIVPPLLLLGLSSQWNQPGFAGKALSGLRYPLIGWLSGVGAMWFWHISAFCDAAADNGGVHAFQTLSLLIMGALFWGPILGPERKGKLSTLPGILYLFTACAACSLLGIWITFTSVSVCPIFMNMQDNSGIMPMIHGSWGLTHPADQQIGGLLMWVPACLVYLGAILVLLGRFYRRPDKTGPNPVKETDNSND
jgi:cytochrome c oxidase assembly factor CtaG